jgi:hypothetical protein
VVSEVRALKIARNRLRVQWQAGDLLCRAMKRVRAHSIHRQRAGPRELIQSLDVNDRAFMELLQTPQQLRQEFLNTVARRDPKLAYNFPARHAPACAAQHDNQHRTARMESNLEMNLLAQVAGSDPRLALQNAEAALDKGQFPKLARRLLAQLQEKDKEAAAKLKDKLFKKLNAEVLLNASGRQQSGA